MVSLLLVAPRTVTADSLKGTLHPSNRPFKRLGDWIESFLESTEALSSQWREMFLDQKDFWGTLPQIVQVLWKRWYAAIHRN